MSAFAHDLEQQEWQRLDPRMLLIHPIREVIRFLPAVIGLALAGTAFGPDGGWELIAVVVPIGLGLLRYLTTRFRISQGRIELRRGLLNRHVQSTPLDRVRTVDLTSPLIHRLLGLTTVRIGTGTAVKDKDDALELDGLPLARAREMRSDLLRVGDAAAEPAAATTGIDVVTDPATATADAATSNSAETTVLTLDTRWLRLAPFTSSGLVITAALGGVLSQGLGMFGRDAGIRVDGDQVNGLSLGPVILILLVAVPVSVVLTSLLGYIVTNWGFRLSTSPGTWHLSRGLLTTRETTLDDDRVAGVSVGEPLGLRAAGGARLSAIVTGLDDEVAVSAMTPPAPRAVVDGVAAQVLGTPAPVDVALTKHGRAATRRRYTRALTPVVILLAATLIGVGLALPWWALIAPALLVPFAVLLAADRARALGHAVVEQHMVARSGSLLRRRDMLDAGHIIGWNFHDSWFQRRVGLVTAAATMGGGRGSVRVPDVPEQQAVTLAATTLPAVIEQFLIASPTGN